MVEGGGWRVEGAGWRVEVAGWRVEGGGWRVWGLGFRVQGVGCRVHKLKLSELSDEHEEVRQPAPIAPPPPSAEFGI